jgi:hypothetical protein
MSLAVWSYADTVLRYFNPSRSPYYAIIAVGVVSLELADTDLKGTRWAIVATILLTVIATGVSFSLVNKADMAKAEYLDQLSFSRSICVSAALISLWYFAKAYTDDFRFWVVLAFTGLQVITFLLYIWARADKPEELQDTNYVQLGLITTTLFVGFLFLLKEAVLFHGSTAIDWFSTFTANVAATALFILWLLCLRVWWRLIRRLVILFGRRSP